MEVVFASYCANNPRLGDSIQALAKGEKRVKNRIVVSFWVALFGLTGLSCSEGQNAGELSAVLNPPSWEGVWVAEKRFGPQLKGPLTVQRSGTSWIARIQGETVLVDRSAAEDGSVSWSFAFFDHGRFEGWQGSAEEAIQGHWLQASGMMDGYPFATPVHLESVGRGAFQGEIRPVPQEVSLNIPLIPEDADSKTYRTFLRNPQRNLGVYFRIESATVQGDQIRFANGDGEVLATGQVREPGERFSLVFPRFNETLDFTRRSRQNAPGFYPRRSPESPATLPAPAETQDGWSTATPFETGLDEEPLARLVSSIAAFEPTGLRQPYIHGLLIAHRGKLVVEEYFHGHHRDLPHDSRSAGKSLGSVLLGIALHQGALASVDQPVYSFFGGVQAFENPDPRKERMTVKHLVTMSSGFHCHDDNYDNPGNEDTMQSQDEQPDWYRYTLDLPMVREPGEAGAYCTAGINLVGGVLRKATGRSLPRFFQEELAEPLDIPYYQMNLSPTYRGYMGGGIRLRPRDFLKLGQLYLDGGVWNGQRIVSEDWVRESSAPQASLYADGDYGFAWWRQSYEVRGRTIETYYASGNGGQLLFVVPELDLTVMIQAGNYGDGRTRNQFRDRYMGEFILPAALAGE